METILKRAVLEGARNHHCHLHNVYNFGFFTRKISRTMKIVLLDLNMLKDDQLAPPDVQTDNKSRHPYFMCIMIFFKNKILYIKVTS